MKNKFKIIIVLVIGIMIGTIGYVIADNVVSIINANQVGYNNAKSEIDADNIQDAIDELYDMSKTHCPDNYNCNDTRNSRVVPATYGETFKAIVYLDPTNPSLSCTQTSYLANIAAHNLTTPVGLTEGCMKWYAYSETATTYNLILDHNIVQGSMDTVNQYLENLIKTKENSGAGWLPSLEPTLIELNEIKNITGMTDNSGYFDSNCSTSGSCGKKENKYYWLFDYTIDCSSYGCDESDASAWGYKTKTCYNATCGAVYLVDHEGNLTANSASLTRWGLRPVITVNKSNLGL